MSKEIASLRRDNRLPRLARLAMTKLVALSACNGRV